MSRKSKQSTETKHTTAWWEGYHTQQPKVRNPYNNTTSEQKEWNEGWHCRYYGEKP